SRAPAQWQSLPAPRAVHRARRPTNPRRTRAQSRAIRRASRAASGYRAPPFRAARRRSGLGCWALVQGADEVNGANHLLASFNAVNDRHHFRAGRWFLIDDLPNTGGRKVVAGRQFTVVVACEFAAYTLPVKAPRDQCSAWDVGL